MWSSPFFISETLYITQFHTNPEFQNKPKNFRITLCYRERRGDQGINNAKRSFDVRKLMKWELPWWFPKAKPHPMLQRKLKTPFLLAQTPPPHPTPQHLDPCQSKSGLTLIRQAAQSSTLKQTTAFRSQRKQFVFANLNYSSGWPIVLSSCAQSLIGERPGKKRGCPPQSAAC